MTDPMNPVPATLSSQSLLSDAELPLVAILRGLPVRDAAAVADVLYAAGFRLIEVPLNSPEPLRSIELICRRLPDCLVGAGTVVTLDELAAVRDVGGRLIVSPHFDPELVTATVANGLVALPGVATPSEAFAALRAGTRTMKIFPAEMISPPILKSWQAVLRGRATFFPVGGISPENMGPYVEAGAQGFGLGSALYRPGDEPARVAERARRFVAAWQALHGRYSA